MRLRMATRCACRAGKCVNATLMKAQHNFLLDIEPVAAHPLPECLVVNPSVR